MAFLQRIADWFYRGRRKLAAGALFVLVFMLGVHVVFGANGFLAYKKKRAEYRTLGQDVERIPSRRSGRRPRSRRRSARRPLAIPAGHLRD